MSKKALLNKNNPSSLIEVFSLFYQTLQKESQKILADLKQINDGFNEKEPVDVAIVKDEIFISKKHFAEASITLKEIQEMLSHATLGYDQKQKQKLVKENYFKEVNRNKTLIQERITWLYDQKDVRDTRRSTITKQNNNNSSATGRDSSGKYSKQDSNQLQLVDLVDINDVEFDKMIIEERDKEINQLYQDAQDLQKVVADVNVEVNHQGESLDIVMDNQVKTKDNLVETNKQLVKAGDLQSSANNKCLIPLIIAFVVAVGIIVCCVIFI